MSHRFKRPWSPTNMGKPAARLRKVALTCKTQADLEQRLEGIPPGQERRGLVELMRPHLSFDPQEIVPKSEN